MGQVRWIGKALAVAQVDTLTIGGTLEVGDLLIATINGKAFSHSATSATLATAATAFAAAWNALSSTLYPEFYEITAAATSGGALTLTAKTPGKPFTVTVSTTESNGGAADAQTFGRAATTANSGPKCWGTAANWDTGVAPIDADDVLIDQGGDILYDLDQSGIQPATLTILQSYTGKIGLPPTNKDSSNINGYYPEYRDQYLKIGPVALTIGEGPGAGSGRIKINTGSDPCVARIINTGQSEDNANGAVMLRGGDGTSDLHAQRGTVDYCRYLGETADLDAITIGTGATVYLGPGCTLSDATISSSGTLTINSAVSGTGSVTIDDGTCTINGTGGIVGLKVRGGTCVFNTSGTLGGAPVVSGKGHLDFGQERRTKTVTNAIEVYGPDAKVSDPYKVVSALVLDLNETANNANINIGRDVRLTRGTPS